MSLMIFMKSIVRSEKKVLFARKLGLARCSNGQKDPSPQRFRKPALSLKSLKLRSILRPRHLIALTWFLIVRGAMSWVCDKKCGQTARTIFLSLRGTRCLSLLMTSLLLLPFCSETVLDGTL